ncbi:MAG: glutamate racemase [Chloroflexota bacterium]
MSDNRPIGVFDSGVGGLTVLEALHRCLPGESTIYLGDLARCPYGPRDQREVEIFALQLGDLLAGQSIKLLVVACNTATAAAYHRLSDRYDFPVIGVIEPGARAAAGETITKRVGVVATEGTVASGAYRMALQKIDRGITPVERAIPWLVPLIERGVCARDEIAGRLSPLLAEIQDVQIDVLILGCTHFPLARDIFQALVGPEVHILDSAEAAALEARRTIVDLDMAAEGVPCHRFLVTGAAESFARRAEAMFSFVPSIETVSLEVLAGG